jgi:hypothetical protein
VQSVACASERARLLRQLQVFEPVAEASGVVVFVAFASGTLASGANASDFGSLPKCAADGGAGRIGVPAAPLRPRQAGSD